MDTQLDLWEVFVQGKSGGQFMHAGSVHASDKEMALKYARDLYTRRNEGSAIWVVLSNNIVSSAPEDAEMFLTPPMIKFIAIQHFIQCRKEHFKSDEHGTQRGFTKIFTPPGRQCTYPGPKAL